MSEPEGIASRVEDIVEQRFSRRFNEVAQYLLGMAPDDVPEQELDGLTNELDALWPYNRDTCYISGDALYPVYDAEGSQIDETYGRIDGVLAQSQGVLIRQLPGNDTYQPYHLFVQKAVRGWTFITKQDTSLSHILLEGGGNIVPTSYVDAIYGDATERSVVVPEGFREELAEYSNWFTSKIRSKSFRRQPQVEQAAFVTDFLSFCQDRFNVWRAAITFEADYCLRPIIDRPVENSDTVIHDGLNYEFVPTRGHVVSGTIQGFESPERAVVQARQQKFDRDMYDPKAGLCLAISIEPEPNPAGLKPNEVILLPLSSQAYNLRFRTAAGNEESSAD